MAHHARLVIIGAGIVGASCAYHLTKLGWKDIVIVDKGELPYNDGSTSHAPGGVVVASHSKLLTRMAFHTSRLLRELPPYDDEFNQFNPVGSLDIARSARRWEDLKRLHGACKSFGIETALMSPQEARALMPLLNPAKFEGALFIKENGIVKGYYAVGSLLREAEKTGGARVVPRTLVTDLEVTGKRVTAVSTANPEIPRIECEAILLCTNIWSSALSDKVGVPTPLMAFEHQYVITEPIGALSRYDRSNKDHEVTFPTTRDLDKTAYFRQHWDSVGVGSYWHEPHRISPHALTDDQTATHPFTPQDFTETWRLATELLPDLHGAKLVKQFNYEAGLGWLAKMDKGDFIGREATLSAKEKGIRKKLCCFTFDEPDAVALGYEPIFGDNACIGHVTTSNFGYTLGRQIAYGYLPKEYSAQGIKLEVEYFNRRFTATVQAEPLYDPRMTRLK